MSNINKLEEEARKRRTFNPEEATICTDTYTIRLPKGFHALTETPEETKRCPHKNTKRMHLLISSYLHCLDCKEDL